MKRFLYSVIIGAIIISAAVSGCTKKGSPNAASEKITIRVANFTWATWNAQVFVAYQKGFFDEVFAEDNVTVELIGFANGPAVNEAFASGAVDIVNGIGDQPIVAGIGNGLKITVLSATSTQGKNIGVIVPDSSSIKDISQLKGKKIGIYIGTYVHKSLLGVLADAGITEDDVSLVNITTGSDGFAALVRGDVDGYVAMQGLIIDQAKKQGLGNLIANFENYPAGSFIVIRDEFLNKNQELTRKFLIAVNKAQRWIEDNREESYEVIGELSGIGSENVRLNNQGADIFLGITERERNNIRSTYEFIVQKGLLHTKVEDLDSHIDGSLINEIVNNGQ
jgi:ABC-type nitrate/sulfonate/bicarbonate transport system substrate-binding protein